MTAELKKPLSRDLEDFEILVVKLPNWGKFQPQNSKFLFPCFFDVFPVNDRDFDASHRSCPAQRVDCRKDMADGVR